MYNSAVITISDRAYSGKYSDKSGPQICTFLKQNGYSVNEIMIIPDDEKMIINSLNYLIGKNVDLIITVGGTGFAKRDITPEATKKVIEREVPGISEYMRYKSAQITERAILSRGVSGIKNNSLIINLPGSPKAAKENLGFVIGSLSHGLDMLNGMKE